MTAACRRTAARWSSHGLRGHNHLLKAMLHTTCLAGFRDVDQENRCIVAASVQMYQGAVGFREIPAARFQSQEIEAEALVDRDALRFRPIAIWVQQNLVALARAAHSLGLLRATLS